MQAAPNSQMHRHLFSRFPKFTSHDAEEVRHQVSRIFCDHDLEFRMRHERNITGTWRTAHCTSIPPFICYTLLCSR